MTLNRIILDKLRLVQHPKEALFSQTLKDILDHGHTGPWREECGRLFTKILTRIAVEENVSPFDDDESEILFKHHLPDFVTGMIQALEELIFSPIEATDFVAEIEAFETTLHLLLRLMEWTVWNYEGGRCIYGKDSAQKAESIFHLAAFEIEVWGDRDEVWLNVIDLLESEYDMKKAIESGDTVYSCTTYSTIVYELPPHIVMNREYWQTALGIAPCLIVSVQSRIVDQTRLRIALKDLKEPAKALSSGVFEADILNKIANSCGTPFNEFTLH